MYGSVSIGNNVTNLIFTTTTVHRAIEEVTAVTPRIYQGCVSSSHRCDTPSVAHKEGARQRRSLYRKHAVVLVFFRWLLHSFIAYIHICG